MTRQVLCAVSGTGFAAAGLLWVGVARTDAETARLWAAAGRPELASAFTSTAVTGSALAVSCFALSALSAALFRRKP